MRRDRHIDKWSDEKINRILHDTIQNFGMYMSRSEFPNYDREMKLYCLRKALFFIDSEIRLRMKKIGRKHCE